ncbi:tyrosine-type recombinase/integrase [Brevibacillus laterosporus]|uniref:tyrosine-type recombinase/integrase n=1 Tax=Brevibacillus laterosporus TaxID=1465 RepID=UPI0013C5353D|nr:tyrosine-type recombinase/integrase [Brevibacillus laterosporus]MBM7109650.1 Tyrosine recombinase XerC [Brevibacillus laterosporus]
MNTGVYQAFVRPANTLHQHPVIVLDREGRLHLPLTVFVKEAMTAISNKSVRTYLSALLPFMTWLEVDDWQIRSGNRWDGPPEQVRQAVDDYLIQKLRCKVRQHKYGFQVVEITGESLSTIRVFLSALKLFYGITVNRGYYPFPCNPMIDWVSKQSQEATEKLGNDDVEFPTMSSLGGTEVPRQRRRLSDSYFRVQGDDWVPQIVDDPKLPGLVLKGGNMVKGWGLREECIVRILFESSGRISEVLSLTLGDWYARGLLQEANAISKGSNGKRVKFLRWHDETAKLLRRYFDTDRRKNDPNGYGVEDYLRLAKQRAINLLEVPLFLTERRTALSPITFRQHYWNAACRAADIDVDVHQARHWYVTMAIRTIYETSTTEGEIQRRLRELVEYMKWKSGNAMIEVYQHYFDAQRHAEVQDQVYVRMEESLKQAMIDMKRGSSKHKLVEKQIVADSTTNNEDLAFLMDIIGGSE